MPTQSIPVISDVSFAELLADPYPTYARARAMAPVVRIEAANLAIVTRFDDIMAIERDPETFSSNIPESLVTKLLGPSVIRKDGAQHATERASFHPAVNPSTTTRCWGPMLEDVVDRVLEALAPLGEADLFSTLAEPIAGEALALILGLPDISWQTMARWSQSLMDGNGNYAGDPVIAVRAEAAIDEIRSSVDTNMRRLHDAPDQSLLSSMMQAGLDREQIHGNMNVSIGGGFNEPRDAMLSLLLGLLTNPDQLASILDDPTLWGQAFEEAVRWISPIGMYPRKLTRDVDMEGILVPKGTQIGLVVAAANHDERKFSHPEHFDAFRPAMRHLGFGAGAHFCAGTWIARILISKIVMPRVFARLPNLRLVDASLVQLRGWVFRGPTHLPVRWDPPPRA